MKKLNSHPYAFMANFVDKYLTIIKPVLEKESPEEASGPIGNVCGRYNKCVKDNGDFWLNVNVEASVRYEMVIRTLHRLLANPETEDKRTLPSIVSQMNRTVYELEMIMQGDKIYEQFRGRKEAVA